MSEETRGPSRGLLEDGVPSNWEKRKVKTLVRRRDYLVAELREAGDDYPSAAHDKNEVAALNWALELVAQLRRNGGRNDRP